MSDKKLTNTPVEESPEEYFTLEKFSQTFSLDGIRATFAEPVSIAPPPPGPAWFGAVMGTGISSTLATLNQGFLPFAHYLALFFLIVGWILLVFLTVGFGWRTLRNPSAFTHTIKDFAQAPMWGMVSMGYLAVGAATATTASNWFPHLTETWFVFDMVLWTIGTVLGIITALGFGGLLINTEIGHPTPVWGLPLVPPMVSATTGSALIPKMWTPELKLWLMVIVIGCFFLALALGLIVFTKAYHFLWRRIPLPLVASAAAWIPLGIVGQSSAAAQAMASQAITMSKPEIHQAILMMAHGYAFVMLSIGVPLFAWAFWKSLTGLIKRMPFTSGWWAMTFPVGTCALGTHLLGLSDHMPWMTYVGFGLFLFLMCTWTLCFVSSGVTILRHQMTKHQEA